MGPDKLVQKATLLAETLDIIDDSLDSAALAEEDRALIEKNRSLFNREYEQIQADIEILLGRQALDVAKIAA